MRWEQSMKIVKRWGVMTLVALLVLGTMGAALADEGTTETESEAAKELPEKGEYLPVLEWADGIVAFVFYWGYGEEDEEPGCDPEETVPTTGGGLFGFGGGLVPDRYRLGGLRAPGRGQERPRQPRFDGVLVRALAQERRKPGRFDSE